VIDGALSATPVGATVMPAVGSDGRGHRGDRLPADSFVPLRIHRQFVAVAGSSSSDRGHVWFGGSG